MKRTITSLIILLGFVYCSASMAAQDYPGRSDYPDVLVYEKAELFKALHKVILVDTRSPQEYETFRIKGALNIPLSSFDFAEKIKQLRATTTKAIVFYCNGPSCDKCYRAGRKANILSVKDTYAYDGGVYDWAKSFPNHIVLLGKSPQDIDNMPTTKTVQSSEVEHISFAGP